MENKKFQIALFLLIFSILFAFRTSFAVAIQVSSIAKKPCRTYVSPNYSDILISSRWFYLTETYKRSSTVDAIKNFHATNMQWLYTDVPADVTACRNAGIKMVNLAITPFKYADNSAETIRNSSGISITAPWVTWPNAFMGCANRPDHRTNVIGYMKDLIDAGADTIHFDDYLLNVAAKDWGGCYCSVCINPAVTSQDQNLVRAFYNYLATEINFYAGRTVRFSMNNYRANWNYSTIHKLLFYIGMAELPDTGIGNANDPVYIRNVFNYCWANCKIQILTLPFDNVAKNRRVFDFCYANGMHMLVPWDVNIGSERYYGQPEDYAPLTAFVRAMAQKGYIDGYEDAYITGPNIKDLRYTGRYPITQTNTTTFNGVVYMTVRAKPNQINDPVIIHIIEWENNTGSYYIDIDLERFFGKSDQKIKATFYRPKSRYIQSEHDNAQITGNFSSLVESWGKTVLYKNPPFARVGMNGENIDDFKWGILVVEKK